MKNRIHYSKPTITDLEVKFIKDAAKNGWGSKCYEYIEKFEDKFKNYNNAKYAIATSSCTGALHMGLHALGVGPGDEVILADINWVATVSPIIHLGAKPVFVDILSDSWCLDPIKVEDSITSKTKAIIAVHIYGNLCEMESLLAISKKYRVPIIEDSAEALGSVYHGEKTGSMGKFGTFSFHGTKTITTGEGGMFVTNDENLYNNVLTLSNHGREKNEIKQFWPEQIGFKYKITNIQAALGCAQMDRVHEIIKKKRKILAYYKQKIEVYEQFTMNPEPKGTINGAWMPTVVINKELKIDREIFLKAFNDENIDARVFFWPLTDLPMFNKNRKNLISKDISRRAINLPSYYDITEQEMDRVIEIILSFLKKK